ncbi:MAG: metal ABC transporter ATP-binding protein [Coriobacteriia bacterium]|nr:metal ABC transporter ATP-binding protein [Coriobacteriia bacterium]
MVPIISCKNVSFSYEGKTVVADVDFAIEQGDYLCVVGENGSGKSTLIKGIIGLKQAAAGRIERAEGLNRTAIGYLPQQSLIQRSFPTSVMEIVLSGRLGSKRFISFYTKNDRVIAARVLEKLGLLELASSSFGELSGGQQQRVLLARALAASPDKLKLLILDEPMNGLDPHIKQELYEVIKRLNEDGLTIIMATHDVNTAVSYASKMLLLDEKQEFFGTAHDFQHTGLGRELMRDSCGGHCAICGLAVDEP